MAALLAAEAFSLPYSGFVPLRYTNELGEFGIPERFRPCLTETSTTASAERTEKNIQAADGILTISFARNGRDMSEISQGTQHGIDYALMLGKKKDQLLFIYLPHTASVDGVSKATRHEIMRTIGWIRREKVTRCAIGGPRESESPGTQAAAYNFLCDVFSELVKQ